MKKIDGFQITGMAMSGFKCYQELTQLTFGNPTVITGGNGSGKSSIADAITFAITGLPFFGERGIDRLHSEQWPELFISLSFIDEDGQGHELIRTRQKDRMTITYDGDAIRQRDLNEMFGEKEVFLSIFNPLYFIEELGEEGKKLLERYLPAISHEDVLSKLSEPVRAALENEPISSPEVYLKKRREEIRDLEQTVVYLTGQKDLANSQKQDAEKKVVELQKQLDDLLSEQNLLEAKRFEGLDLADMREKLVDISAQYEEMAQDGPDNVDTTEIDEKLKTLHHKLGQRSAEQYIPKYTHSIAEASARVKELGAKYSREASLLKGFRPGTVCPTCRRAVTKDDFSVVQREIQKSIDAIIVEGKARKGQLDELQALEKQTEDTFLQFQQDDVAKINQEIEELIQERKGRSTDRGEQRKTELESLHTQIQALTADIEYGNLTQEEYDRLMECREQLHECQVQLDAAKSNVEAVPEDYEGKISRIECEIKDKTRLLRNVALYVSKRAELLFSKLAINKVKISLYDVVKTTGEAKDVFKFTYDGRRYDWLSLSEKIRAGMEVSELMKRLTGRNYPIFIDNMESVDDLANVKPTGQVIMTKCVHGAALSVKPMNQMYMQKAA